MAQYFTFKVITQSILEGFNQSYFFGEYILIGDCSTFVENDELVISNELVDLLKDKIEDIYENADGETVSVQLLEIVYVEEVVDKVTSEGLNVLMYDFYYFEDPISSEEFLKRYPIDK